jgi:hypothetical protein
VVSGTPIDIIAGRVVGPGILARKIEKEKRPDVAASSKTGRCQSPPARRGPSHASSALLILQMHCVRTAHKHARTHTMTTAGPYLCSSPVWRIGIASDAEYKDATETADTSARGASVAFNLQSNRSTRQRRASGVIIAKDLEQESARK